MHVYERWMVLKHFSALLRMKALERAPGSSSNVLTWIETHERALGLPPLRLHEEEGENLLENLSSQEKIWPGLRLGDVGAQRLSPRIVSRSLRLHGWKSA